MKAMLLCFAFVAVLAVFERSWGQDIAAGKKIYAANCASCHGDSGKGDGVAGKVLPAKPADHTNGVVMNALTEKWLYEIIAKGGGAVGKSHFMPGWSGSLSDRQIRDVIAYIRSLAAPPHKK